MSHVTVLYFGYLQERAGTAEEQVQTQARTIIELFNERAAARSFTCPASSLRFACNETFCPADHPVGDADVIAFMPPLSGG